MNSEHILYLDLDGVLTDFEKSFKDKSNGLDIRSFTQFYGAKAARELYLREPISFWAHLEWMYGGKELWEAVNRLYNNVRILSSAGTTDPLRGKTVSTGKTEWIKNHLPSVKETDIFIVPGRHIKSSYATPNSILVDDMSSTIQSWNAAGGIGILHIAKYYKKTIQTLEDMAGSTKLAEIAKRMGY